MLSIKVIRTEDHNFVNGNCSNVKIMLFSGKIVWRNQITFKLNSTINRNNFIQWKIVNLHVMHGHHEILPGYSVWFGIQAKY